jgi:predicted nucleic-acid-binding protein
VVVAELAWVLRKQYGVSKTQFIGYIEQLLDSPEIVLEHESALKLALIRCSRANVDIADCLIERICAEAGCTQTVTFDEGAAKLAGMRLL